MCYVIHHKHTECGHIKHTDIIEPCETSPDERCPLIPMHVSPITAPALCISCFRDEEARIDAYYDDLTQTIRDRIAESEKALAQTTTTLTMTTERQVRDSDHRGGAVEERRGKADSYRVQLEQDLERVKEWRRVQIAMFRADQGVWADG